MARAVCPGQRQLAVGAGDRGHGQIDRLEWDGGGGQDVRVGRVPLDVAGVSPVTVSRVHGQARIVVIVERAPPRRHRERLQRRVHAARVVRVEALQCQAGRVRAVVGDIGPDRRLRVQRPSRTAGPSVAPDTRSHRRGLRCQRRAGRRVGRIARPAAVDGHDVVGVSAADNQARIGVGERVALAGRPPALAAAPVAEQAERGLPRPFAPKLEVQSVARVVRPGQRQLAVGAGDRGHGQTDRLDRGGRGEGGVGIIGGGAICGDGPDAVVIDCIKIEAAGIGEEDPGAAAVDGICGADGSERSVGLPIHFALDGKTALADAVAYPIKLDRGRRRVAVHAQAAGRSRGSGRGPGVWMPHQQQG